MYIRQPDLAYGHIHYKQRVLRADITPMEIFFENGEFNVGYARDSGANRINIRSESIIRLVYKELERSPCPNDFLFYKFR